jgi:hypothetical protein
MGKATRPVSVAGIEFDALISSDYTMEATVPEYAVESGFNVTDAIILKAETLSMVLFVTDTPVTWYNRHGRNRVNSVVAQLENLYYTKTPVSVVTSEKTYSDMAIESIKISKSTENGYAREIPISFRKVRTTSAQTTTIPASYGKSGSTGASAGTASTSSGSSSGSSSQSSSSESSSGSGSVLYNAGKSAGIIS